MNVIWRQNVQDKNKIKVNARGLIEYRGRTPRDPIYKTPEYHKPKEYRAWMSIIDRCYNYYSLNYDWYGEKGITVCEEWLKSFKAFYDAVGPAPTKEHMLIRIDKKVGYMPNNVKWVLKDQLSKKLTTADVLLIRTKYADGVKKTALAKEFDISVRTVYDIVNRRRWKHV